MGLFDKVRKAVVSVVAEAMVLADSRKPVEVIQQPLRLEVASNEVKAEAPTLAVDQPAPAKLTLAKNDPLTILRLLGAVPAERPFYELFGEREEEERPTGKMSDQPYNDADFSTWLKSYNFKVFSIRASEFDCLTQLPIFQLGKQGFYPVASRYGSNLSMVSERLISLDFAMARLGWVRYVTHSSGPKIPDSAHENIEAAGTIWEGYVPLTKAASGQTKRDAAYRLLRESDYPVLLTPKETLELGLPLDSFDKPAEWFILYLNKPLMTKFSGSVRRDGEEPQERL